MKGSALKAIFWYHHKIAEKALYRNQTTSLWAWFVKSVDFFKARKFESFDTVKKEENFVMFYVTNSLRLCVQVLSVNIVLLLITVYIITQRHFGDFHIALDPLFDKLESSIVEISIWILFSIMCLVYFLILSYQPTVFNKLFGLTPCSVWYEIGASILFARLLILITQLVYLANASHSCFDGVDVHGNGDSSIAYMYIQMSIEVYETYTFASLPFPQPWAAVLTIIGLIKQEIRLFSCAERIYQNPSEAWIVQLLAFVLIQMYVCIIWLPASYLECSFRNRYKSMLSQQQADEAKREMVGFLCTGVRVPLQYMLHSVNSIDFMQLSGDNVQPLLDDILNYSRMVNEIADDLLLLVRIRENRYRSKPVAINNIHSLLDAAVLGVLQRHNRGTASPDCYVDIRVPSVPLSVDEKCLLAVVKHLLIFITQEPGMLVHTDNDLSGSHSNLNEALNSHQRMELNLTVKLDPSMDVFPGAAGAAKQLKLTLSGEAIGRSQQSETRQVHEATTVYVCRAIAVCCGGSFVSGQHHYELTMPCSVAMPTPTDSHSPQSPQSPQSPAQNTNNINNNNNNNNNTTSVEQEYNNNNPNTHNPDIVNEYNRPDSPLLDGPETTPSRAERMTDFSAMSSGHENSVGSRPRTSSRPARTLSSNASEPRGSAKQRLDEKLQLSVDLLARFQRRRVCVIVEDSVLENVIVNVVARLRLDEGMSVLHELQKGLVPVAKLTFVTSYQICLDLRARNYPGKIVLFSGSINYLDDEQIANLDYCLPLPASDHQLSLFLDWLSDLHETEAMSLPAGSRKNIVLNTIIPVPRALRNRDRRLTNNSTGAPPVSVVSSQSNDSSSRAPRRRSRCATLCRSVKYIYRSMRNYFLPPGEWFMVPALDEAMLESFYKWKWLNPSRSWYHHSMELYFTAGPRLLMAAFVETTLFKQQLPTVAAVLFVAAIYMGKGLVYKYVLKPCSISMHSYFLIPAVIANGAFLMFIFQMISQPLPPSHRLNLSEYVALKLNDGRDGAQSLYGIIITFAWSRLLGMYLPHPFNLTQNIIVFIFMSLEIWVNFQMLLSWQMCQFVQLMFLQLTLLNLIYMTHVEASYRREFKIAHDHIVNKAFLDHCLEICQQDIRGPLMFLIDRKNDLMKVVVHATYSRAMVVDRALIAKLEPLQMAHLLISEMVTGFAHVHYTSERNELMPIRVNNEIVQLNRAVAGILSGMSSTAEGFHIKIFSEIDNNLAVIRTDWKLLSMILINLVNTALRNIRDFCIAQPRNKDLVNCIKIKIVAIHCEAKLPFVHPRLMLINVCDTSNAASKISTQAQRAASHAASTAAGVTELGQTDLFSVSDIAEQSDRIASGYGHSLCEKLVKRVTTDGIFETIRLDAQYSTVQRFTYHYHLTPQTRRAQEFIDAESAKDYLSVMVCARDYFTNYNRVIRPTERAVTRNGVQQRLPGIKHMVYLSGAEPDKRNETIQLMHHLDTFGWACVVKYVLKVPSMHSIGRADCVLIDQQLELVENVNIADTVLKLRVCGFNGVIAVVLKEGGRNTELIKDELSRSAADIDLLITAPVRDQNIQALTVALEKKCVRQLLYMNGN